MHGYIFSVSTLRLYTVEKDTVHKQYNCDALLQVVKLTATAFIFDHKTAMELSHSTLANGKTLFGSTLYSFKDSQFSDSVVLV